ncbi:MAG: ECF transporter S component [Clostridia bacterium]|nr:ECF transporter S component [Clostridia bacterium]
MKDNKKFGVKELALIAMFCALSFAAVLLGRVIPDVLGFLSYDPKDAVVAVAGFLFGPLYTVLITVIVSVIEMLTISSTGIYGCIMNIVSTVAFSLPAALIYKKQRSYKGAVYGLGAGLIFMTACMVLWNYLITPLYMGIPRGQVAGMLATVFFPFNAIKGGINMALTLLLYKPLVTALRRARLVSVPVGEKKQPYRATFLWVGLALLCVFVLLFLFFSGIL